MLILGIYFLLGLVALAGVDVARGRRAASASASEYDRPA